MKEHASLNRCYRHIWSHATQSWLVAPESARRSRKSSGRVQRAVLAVPAVLASVALAAIASLSHAQQAPPLNQLPIGGVVTRGAASIVQNATPSSAVMNINQSTQRAVIDWSSFNVGQNAKVNFNQPSSSSVTLNRISDQNPSQVFGQINANGQVFLSNPNGVYFSPTAQVDVGGLVATTHAISNDDFMAGNITFNRNGATGSVINQGSLKSSLGGYIALLAPHVQNEGIVVAQAGTVALAAGEAITLNFKGSNSVAGIVTTPSTIASLIDNRLAAQAPDGQIILSAVALNRLQAGVVKNSGSLEASSLVSKGGKILLEGDDIQLASTSTLNATGAQGGGVVLVGGDWQGAGAMRQASSLTVAAGSTMDVSATQQGDGGQVVLRTDVSNPSSQTTVSGKIVAQGGQQGGNGGRIETSGAWLNVQGLQVATLAPAGQTGDWLLDPYNITISTATTSGGALSAGTFTPTANSSVLQNTQLQTALGSSNVTVSTTGAGSQTGTISITAGLSWSSSNTLTLSANSTISGSGAIAMTGGGGVVFNQTGSSSYSGLISGNGSLTTNVTNGTLTLSTSNTYTGATTISAGTLQIASAATLGSGTYAGNIAIASGAQLQWSSSANQTLSGAITGSGSIAKDTSSTSTLTLSAIGGFSGSATVSNGTLAVLTSSPTSITNTFSGVGTLALLPSSAGAWGASLSTSSLQITTGGSSLGNLVLGNANNTSNLTLNGLPSTLSVTGNETYVAGNITIPAGAASSLTTWSKSSLLTLTSLGNITIQTPMSVTGTTAGLVLQTSQSSPTGGSGDLSFGLSSTGFSGNLTFSTPATQTFSTQDGSTGTVKTYTFVSSLANITSATANYALNADINASTLTGRSSVIASYGATLEGLGHSISQLSLGSNTTSSVGFIAANGISNSPTIRDLLFSNASILSAGYAGVLIGSHSNGGLTIQNVAVLNSTVSATTASSYVGGLVGFFSTPYYQGALKNIYVVNTNVSGGSYVGGVMGYGSTGLVLYNGFPATNIYRTGNTTAATNYVGGVFGYFSYSNASNVTSIGNVSLTGSGGYVGGFAGWVYSAPLNGIYNTGNVTATSGSNVGGLLGFVQTGSTLTNGYSMGNVSGASYVGGLVGNLQTGSLTHTFYAGNITATGINFGGLVGYMMPGAALSNSFYDIDTSLINANKWLSAGGIYDGQYTAWTNSNATIANRSLSIGSYLTADGSGYYQIGSVTDGLSKSDLSNMLAFAESGAYKFVLQNDLDMSRASTAFIPYFGGSEFKSAGFAINNFSLNRSNASGLGFFGMVQGSALNNFTLNATAYTGQTNYSLYGVDYVGALFGGMSGGVINNATINLNAGVAGSSYVGGMGGYSVGTNITTANANYANGISSRSTGSDLGGLLGFASSTISNVSANPSLSGSSYVGGLIGDASSSTINNATTVNATIVGSSNNVGGLAGSGSALLLSNSSVTNTTINVANTTSSYVGGLVGNLTTSTAVLNSDFVSNVTLRGNAYVGGLVGNFAAGSIQNSYFSGNITATSNYGGLAGYVVPGAWFYNSYYDIDTSLINAAPWVASGGIYDAQFNDWTNSSSTLASRSLSIASYLSLDSATNAYQISTVTDGARKSDLSNMLAFVLSSSTGVANSYKFELANNLNMANASTPYLPYFSAAQFNGNGFSINNFSLNRPSSANLGFFGVVQNSALVNVNISSVTSGSYAINGTDYVGTLVGAMYGGVVVGSNVTMGGNVKGNNYVGGLAGYAYAAMANDNVSYASASTTSVTGVNYVGGLTGYLNSNYTNATGYTTSVTSNTASGLTSNVAVNATSSSYVGGLIGLSTGGTTVLSNSSATGNVTVAVGNYVGGLIGNAQGGAYSGLTSSGAVINTSTGNYQGGLVGFFSSVSLNTSSSASTVNGSAYVGGLIGYQSGGTVGSGTSGYTIFATGNVTGSSYVGGLVGYNVGGSLVNASASGSVSGPLSSGLPTYGVNYFGGLVGSSTGAISYSKSSGPLVQGGTYVGGAAGYNSGSISNTFSLATVKSNASAAGGLAGYNMGTVSGTSVNLTYAGGAVSGVTSVGGLIGNNASGSVTNASASGTVTATSTGLGGLIGTLSAGAVSTSVSYGTVTGNGFDAGGLVGSMSGTASISNSFAYSNVINTAASSAANSRTGGFVGILNNGTISNSGAAGSVSGTYNVGGFVGYLGGATTSTPSISTAFAAGAVSATQSAVGGFVGYIDGSGETNSTNSYATLSNFYATGSVSGGSKVGGLIGDAEGGTISFGYATGYVSGTSSVGAAVGYAKPNARTSGTYSGVAYVASNGVYYDSLTSNQSVDGFGSGALTTTALQNSLQSGFVSSTWGIGTGLYPYLKVFYSGSVQSVSGTALLSNGTSPAVPAQVSLYSGGSLLNGYSVSTGANGYFYELLGSSTLMPYATSVLTSSSKLAAALTLNGTSSVAGLVYSDAPNLSNGNLVFANPNTTPTLTQGLLQISTAAANMTAANAALSSTLGASTYATIAASLPTKSSLVLNATAANFLLDMPLTYNDGGLSNAGAITVNSANVTLAGANYTSSKTQTYNANLTLAANTSVSATQVITGSTLAGAGYDLTISGALTQDAAMTNLGNLTVSGNAVLLANVSSSGRQSYGANVSLQSNATAVTLNTSYSGAGADLTIGGNVSATGSQGLIVQAGQGNVSVAGSVGTSAGLSNVSITASNVTALAIAANQSITLSPSTLARIGLISGASTAVTMSGSGVLDLTSASNYSGATRITAGTLQLDGTLGSGGNAGAYTGDVAIASGAQLQINATSNQTWSGQLSGSGALLKNSSNSTLTLAGNNSLSSNITVNQGTLAVSNGNALGTAAVQIAAGAKLDIQNVTATAQVVDLNGGTLSASTGAATLVSAVNLGANSWISVAGTGLTLSGAISGNGYGLSASGAGALTLSNASNTLSSMSTNAVLGSLNLTNNAALTLGSINSVGNVTVVNRAPITLSSGASIASSSGNIVLAGTQITNNAGAQALSVGAQGTWQVWSSNPTPFALSSAGGDVDADLPNDFVQYNAAYGSSSVQGVGNGMFYAYAPQLSASLTGTVSKVYDGTVAVNVTNSNYAITGFINGDQLYSVLPTRSVFTTAGTAASVAGSGTGKTVSVSGMTLVGINGSKKVYGYSLTTSDVTGVIGEVTPAPLNLSISKTYDGSPLLDAANYSLTGMVNSEASPSLLAGGVAQVSSANAASYNSFISSSFALNNPNYTLDGGVVNATIQKAPLGVSVTAPYSGTNVVVPSAYSVTGLVNHETLTLSQVRVNSALVASNGANFVTGILGSNGTASLSNYNLVALYNAAANSSTWNVAQLTPVALTVTARADSKVYDANAYQGSAGVDYSGFVNNESSSALGGSLSYSGTSQGAVNVGAYVISPSGLSSSNYNISFVSGNLTITPKTVSLSASKTFDGNTGLSGNQVTITTGINGETLTYSNATASSAHVADNATNFISQLTLGNGTALASNYQLPTTLNATTAHVTISPLPVVLDGTKNFDGTTQLNTSQTGSALTVTNAISAVTASGSAPLAAASAGRQSLLNLANVTLSNSDYTVAGGSGSVNVVAVNNINLQPLNATELATLVGSYLSGLTGSQLGTLSATQLQTLSAQQVASMSQNQLSGMTGTQLSSLTPTQMAAMSATQLGGLSTSQISGLNPTQVQALTPAQLSGFSPAQIAALSASGGLSFSQVQSLSPTQIAAMSASQLTYLSPAQVSALDVTQIQSLTPTQLAVLSTAQINALTASGALSFTQVQSLNPAQVAAIDVTQLISLSPSQMSGLGAAQVQAFTADQLSNLSATQITALTNAGELIFAQVQGLSPTQVAAIGATQLAGMSPDQMAGLGLNQVQALTPTQLTQLAATQITALSASGALSFAQVQSLSPNQITAMSTVQLTGLSPNQLGSLAASQVQAMTPTQLAALNAVQIAALSASGGLSFAQVQSLAPAQMAVINPTQLTQWSPAQMGGLSAVQVQAFTPNQLASFTPEQITALTASGALNFSQVHALTPNQMVAMSEAQFAQLNSAQVASLDDAQLQALTPAQWAAFKPVQLAALDPIQIRALLPTQVAALTPVQLSTLTPIQLMSLNANQLASLTIEQLQGLSASQVLAMTSEQLGELSDAQFAVIRPFLPVANTFAVNDSATQMGLLSKPLGSDTPLNSVLPSTRQTPAVIAANAVTSVAAASSNPASGVLSVSVLGEGQSSNVGVAFEQLSSSIKLSLVPAPVVNTETAITFSGVFKTFMVATARGELVEFKGTLINSRLVVVASSTRARDLARSEMQLVLAAAVTSLGETDSLVLSQLEGVVLDLR